MNAKQYTEKMNEADKILNLVERKKRKEKIKKAYDKYCDKLQGEAHEEETREFYSKAAAALGKKGGASKSEAKKAASKENGKLGGRPKLKKFNMDGTVFFAEKLTEKVIDKMEKTLLENKKSEKEDLLYHVLSNLKNHTAKTREKMLKQIEEKDKLIAAIASINRRLNE